MKKNRGFSLTELLIVMGILAILAIILIGLLNPVAMVNRGRDAKRKDDLNKIKGAFEAYNNDKGFYPSSADIGIWNVKNNCGDTIETMKKYFSILPCDPNGNPYEIISDGASFKVLTNLENKSDKDIPKDWYISEAYQLGDGYTKDDINFGTSSSNILWYEWGYPPECDFDMATHVSENCYEYVPGTGCIHNQHCLGSNCYASDNNCKVCHITEGECITRVH